MPKAKKSKDFSQDEFPALTRLLEEISRHRENELLRPRLPFEFPPTGNPSRVHRGPGERHKKRS